MFLINILFEVDREEDHNALLQKMRNLKKKLVSKAEVAAAEAATKAATDASSNPEEAATAEAGEYFSLF